MCLCYSVIPHVERVLDHAANHLRREQRQLRDKRRSDGVEVGALVVFYAACGDHFLDVRFGPRVGLVPFLRDYLRDMSSHCAQGQWTRAPGGLFLKKWCDQCARLVTESTGRDLLLAYHQVALPALLASMLQDASSEDWA